MKLFHVAFLVSITILTNLLIAGTSFATITPWQSPPRIISLFNLSPSSNRVYDLSSSYPTVNLGPSRHIIFDETFSWDDF